MDVGAGMGMGVLVGMGGGGGECQCGSVWVLMRERSCFDTRLSLHTLHVTRPICEEQAQPQLYRELMYRVGQNRICRVGQNRIYTPYMTVYFGICLSKITFVQCIYMVLTNPTYMHTVYDRMYGKFPAKGTIYIYTVYTYVCMVFANPTDA